MARTWMAVMGLVVLGGLAAGQEEPCEGASGSFQVILSPLQDGEDQELLKALLEQFEAEGGFENCEEMSSMVMIGADSGDSLVFDELKLFSGDLLSRMFVSGGEVLEGETFQFECPTLEGGNE